MLLEVPTKLFTLGCCFKALKKSSIYPGFLLIWELVDAAHLSAAAPAGDVPGSRSFRHIAHFVVVPRRHAVSEMSLHCLMETRMKGSCRRITAD